MVAEDLRREKRMLRKERLSSPTYEGQMQPARFSTSANLDY